MVMTKSVSVVEALGRGDEKKPLLDAPSPRTFLIAINVCAFPDANYHIFHLIRPRHT